MSINTAYTTGFAIEADKPSFQLPMSDDELVIAYSMVAALYQLVLRWSQNETYDKKAQSVAESAESLLLRSDVMRRILHLAGLERRQEFMVDHIELLERQKQVLLDALHPFVHFIENSNDEAQLPKPLGNQLNRTDFTKAKVVYELLTDARQTAKQTDEILN